MRFEALIRATGTAAAMLVLVGCELHLDLDVNADGSGTIASTVEITPADRQLGLTPTQIRKEIEQDAARRGQSVQVTEGKLQNGNEYVRSTATFRNVQDLSRREGAHYSFTTSEQSRAVSFRLFDPGLAQAFVPVTVQITMPGKIVSSNGDSLQGRTARWSPAAVRRFAGSDGLSVTSEPSVSIFSGSIALVTVAILGITAAARYFRRQRTPVAGRQAVRAAAATAGAGTTGTTLPREAYCGDCGAALRQSSRFCPKCGAAQ